MKASVKTILVTVPFVLVLGGVYWLGSSQGDGASSSLSLSSVLTTSSGSGTPTTMAASGSVAAPAVQAEAPPPVKVPLSDDEKRSVLAKFYEAAEKDVARVESDISKARAAGKSMAEIAVLEAKLEKMRQVLQQTRLRHPGY